MTRALLLAALTSCAHGSVYRSHALHVGIRPVLGNDAAGLTVRVTADVP